MFGWSEIKIMRSLSMTASYNKVGLFTISSCLLMCKKMERIYRRLNLVVPFTCLLLLSKCCADTVTISTSVGKIAGYTETVAVDGVSKTISKFIGIPYAESAAGQNRFLKPVPKAPFVDTFQAVSDFTACFEAYPSKFRNMTPYLKFTEDCLILNIYVPHTFNRNVSLPVMVWIHGGAFVGGASSQYHGEILSAFINTIVITINYRLGMFGFLRSADGKLPGNQGLWDQHLALKWVHENIAAFSGDPGQVTIFGESAGGASVLFQALYPGNKGHFQRVIAESGSPLAIWSTMPGPNIGAFVKRVGCDKAVDDIACLRSITANELSIDTMLMIDQLQFLPVVDGDFLQESPEIILTGSNPISASAREFYSSLDILSGVNDFEGGLYVLYVWQQILGYTNTSYPVITRTDINDIIIPYVIDQIIPNGNDISKQILQKLLPFRYTNWSDPDSFESTRNNLLTLSSDVAFFQPAIIAANAHASLQRGKTYFYEYNYEPEKKAKTHPSWLRGASHGEEVSIVLCYPLNDSDSSGHTDDDRRMSRSVATMWSNFVKSGDPNQPDDVTGYIHTKWPEYDLASHQYLEISSPAAVKDSFYPERMALWTELVPQIKQSFVHGNTDRKSVV